MRGRRHDRVFRNATHCWDCKHLNGFSKKDFRGTNVVYRYDSGATQETRRRIFEFLKNLGGGALTSAVQVPDGPKESEELWHVLIISYMKKGVETKAIFSFLKIGKHFGLGDID